MLRRLFAPSGDWSLHNPLKGWTLHVLSLREARLVVSTLSLPEKKTALVWRRGLEGWSPLEDEACAVLLEDESSASAEAPPLPKEERHDEVTAVRPERPSTPARTQERAFDRVSKDVPAEILMGSQSFSTVTDNFSEGGLKFKDRLPEWVAGYFTVILHLPERKFEITCMLVEDQKTDKTRVATVETDDEESHLPHYRAWVRGHFS